MTPRRLAFQLRFLVPSRGYLLALLAVIALATLHAQAAPARWGDPTGPARSSLGVLTLHNDPAVGVFIVHRPSQGEASRQALPDALAAGRITLSVGESGDMVVIGPPGAGEQVTVSYGSSVTIHAIGDIVLHGAEVSADLTVVAGGTLSVHDSPHTSVTLVTGGRLLLQGDIGVDIYTLQHSESVLRSAGDLVLRSDAPIKGDAHFKSGSAFRVERLDGSPGALVSPHDPIVLAEEDVTLGDYTGASLHILAGGSITLGSVEITGPDTAGNTINPSNDDTFAEGERPTFADLADVHLSDGKTVIIVDGSARATLDVRAGIDWGGSGPGKGGTIVGTISPGPDIGASASGSAITTGDINVAGPAGMVLLTNQYLGNSALPDEGITIGGVNVSVATPGEDAGSIFIDSRGTVLGSGHMLASASGPGTGGSVTVLAGSTVDLTFGPALTGGIFTSVFASEGGAGDGGNVTVVTTTGHITVHTIDASSQAPSGAAGGGGSVLLSTPVGGAFVPNTESTGLSTSALGDTAAGNAGSISIDASLGIVLSGHARADTVAWNGTAGDGGAITLTTTIPAIGHITTGNITTGNLTANSNALHAGNGGDISLDAAGAITTALVSSGSGGGASGAPAGSASNGGEITLVAGGGVTTGTLSTSVGPNDFSAPVSVGSGNTIHVESTSGNVHVQGSVRTSATAVITGNTAGHAGPVTLLAPGGSVTVNDSVSAFVSGPGGAGNGGTVTIDAAGGATTGGIVSLSFSGAGDAGNGGGVSITAGSGNVAVTQINSRSQAPSGDASHGGPVTLSASGGSVSVTGGALTMSAIGGTGTGNAGDVSITAAIGISVNGALEAHTSVQDGTGGNGGSVVLQSASGNVALRDISTRALADTDDTAGDGGLISVTALNGDLVIQGSIGSTATSFSSGATVGDSGDITLLAPNGSVSVTGNIFADAISGASDGGNAGNGGDVTVEAKNGVTLSSGGGPGFITSFSSSTGGSGGHAGNVSVTTEAGDIVLRDVRAHARGGGSQGTAGNGGSVTIVAGSGSITTGPPGAGLTAPLRTSSFGSQEAGDGGHIALTAGGSITVHGNVEARSIASGGVAGSGGSVSLAATGDITTGLILTDLSGADVGDGGTVTVDSATGNVALREISTRARPNATNGTGGNGGPVSITASNGSITLGDSELSGFVNTSASTFESGASVGDGGSLALMAPNGGITVAGAIFADAFSAHPEGGDVGNGGSVTIEAKTDVSLGNPGFSSTTGFINAFARSDGGNAGNGGNVSITADKGSIALLRHIHADARGSQGTAGHGGAITLVASGGSVEVSLSLLSSSQGLNSATSASLAAGSGGPVRLSAGGNVSAAGISTNTSASLATGTAGDAGPITLIAMAGDVVTGNLIAHSNALHAGKGGDISVNAGGAISLGFTHAGSGAGSDGGSAVDGGAMAILAGGHVTTGFLNNSVGPHGGALVDVGSGGTVHVESTGGSVHVQAAISTRALGRGEGNSSGDGGPVTLLAPAGSITVDGTVATHSSHQQGGAFALSADGFIRLLGAETSVDSSGPAAGGSVVIAHGGRGEKPFIVGDASISGTAGAITTGEAIIAHEPPQSFLGNHFEAPNIWIIAEVVALSITTETLPGGTEGEPYSASLAATGGMPTYAWAVIEGSLPSGLELDASTGEISGTPSEEDTFTFTIQVTDSGEPPQSESRELTIVVAPAEDVAGPDPDPDPDPSVLRYAGANRFETAAEISKSDFPDPAAVSTVFVAVGSNFPDALAGAAAAAQLGAPLLLVNTDSIPPATATELSRLDPDEIVVLGGEAVISPAVATGLGAFGAVTRLAGPNRYATAVEISKWAFDDPGAVEEVVIATGANFPDALGGGPVAVAVGGPVLLVQPDALPAVVRAEIERLAPVRITVLGGSAAISDAVVVELNAIAETTRVAGANRFATAIEASKHGFDGSGRVYVAVGTNFPDALAGAAAAGFFDAPVLLVPSNMLPAEVAAEITRVGAHTVIILGGTAVVSAAVEAALKALLGA